MIKRSYGAHPLMLINIIKPFLFVLILPVIKGVLQYLTTRKITGVLTLEIIAAATVLLFAVLSFRAFRISIDDSKMTIEKGFLLKSTAVIKRERLSSVTSVRGPLDMVFGSVTYKVNTEAGRWGRTDFSFKLCACDAKEVSGFLYGGENRTAVRFGVFSLAVFAAATSSAFTGIALGVPIINNLGKILGVALNRMFFDEISRASTRFNAYFPPIVNIATLILILGYIVSFFISLIKMLAFRLRIGEEKTEAEHGVLVRRRTIFKKSAVNNVCIEQTPIMRAFNLFSMRAAVGGYGDNKGEKAVIVPAARHFEIKNQFNAYFPFLHPSSAAIKAKRSKRNVLRFLWPARFYAALDVGITTVFSLLFPSVLRFLMLLGAVIMVLIVYYGNLCFVSYRFGKLCIGDIVFASGFSALTIRELYCEKAKVGEIKIIRTPADIIYGTCKAEIIICSESADKIRVRNISYEETLKKIEQTYKISE